MVDALLPQLKQILAAMSAGHFETWQAWLLEVCVGLVLRRDEGLKGKFKLIMMVFIMIIMKFVRCVLF